MNASNKEKPGILETALDSPREPLIKYFICLLITRRTNQVGDQNTCKYMFMINNHPWSLVVIDHKPQTTMHYLLHNFFLRTKAAR